MQLLANHSVNYSRNASAKEIRKAVKQLTGFDVRRMDTFTLLALQTLFYLLKEQKITGTTGLYGVANYFSVDLLQSLITNVEQQEPIRPFDFILSVGNAANFYLAKQFKLSGPNVFLGASKQAVESCKLLARTDLEIGLADSAIVVHWQESLQSYQCSAQLLKLPA